MSPNGAAIVHIKPVHAPIESLCFSGTTLSMQAAGSPSTLPQIAPKIAQNEMTKARPYRNGQKRRITPPSMHIATCKYNGRDHLVAVSRRTGRLSEVSPIGNPPTAESTEHATAAGVLALDSVILPIIGEPIYHDQKPKGWKMFSPVFLSPFWSVKGQWIDTRKNACQAAAVPEIRGTGYCVLVNPGRKFPHMFDSATLFI